MALNYETNKVLVWDYELNKMVQKTEVKVQFVGNRGTLIAEEGPYFCETGQEIWEATQKLKKLLIESLIGDTDFNDTSNEY